MPAQLLLLLLLFFAVPATAQESIRKYIKRHLVPIRTVAPDSLRFSDLDVLGKAIGDVRVVMLGEQDHGDAPALLTKTGLIKSLHEQKGFDVLAFESDFLALNEGWEKVEKEKGIPDTFLRKNIYLIWTASRQCEDLPCVKMP